MCRTRFGVVVPLLFVAPLLLTSCLSRQRIITRSGHPANQTPLNADKAQLIKSVADSYEAVKSFNATLNLRASTGSVYKGEIKDYEELSAYIDFRKPEDIRVVALLPLIASTAFQMVSDGRTFRVSIPPKNRFIEGLNNAPPLSKNPTENIRPDTFLSAMLVKPVDPANEFISKVDDITEQYDYYQMEVFRRLPGGDPQPYRRITFDRVNLLVIEQREYDADGGLVSLTKYGDWQTYGGIRFPSHIDISRPLQGFGVELVILKMEMNLPVPDSKFVLQRPEGSVLQIIGSPSDPEKVAK